MWDSIESRDVQELTFLLHLAIERCYQLITGVAQHNTSSLYHYSILFNLSLRRRTIISLMLPG
jgi:hypothetical protein